MLGPGGGVKRMLPRCLGVGGGAYHTRVPLLIGMLKLSASFAGCADARCYLVRRSFLAAIAVSRGRKSAVEAV